jgi:neutral ceramidase
MRRAGSFRFCNWVLAALVAAGGAKSFAQTTIEAGLARVKITGPVWGPLLMGYANPSQHAYGIHMDLFARAFVLREPRTHQRVALVNLDLSQINEALRRAVLDRLQILYGDRYQDNNLLLSATHTHSALGGLSHYRLYNIASMGFEPDHFRLVVDRIVEAIQQAEAHLQPARLEWVEGHLPGVSKNRSLEAFNQDPDRSVFPSGIDDEVQQINIRNAQGRPLGFWNLFAVHGTSLPNTERYVSGDNKGWAGWKTEKEKNIVAAFANGAAGDVSPDPLARNNREEIFQATRKVAEAQSRKGLELLEQRGRELTTVSSALNWVEMPKVQGQYDGHSFKLCEPAIGYSMIAGAEDGRGSLPGVNEGITVDNFRSVGLFPRMALGVLKKIFSLSVNEDAACHGNKPVLFHTGSPGVPGTPRILPFQLIRLGPVILASLPFEPTTLSGYRIRRAILESTASEGVRHVLLVGYANAYSGYLSTPEEYDMQHYEGASTHFGRETLLGVISSFRSLISDSKSSGVGTYGSPPPRTEAPRWSHERSGGDNLFTGEIRLGSVFHFRAHPYRAGDWISASFNGANPDQDLAESRQFLSVQKKGPLKWQTIATEEDPETWIRWEKILSSPRNDSSSLYRATITWRVPEKIPEGIYRIRFTGRTQGSDDMAHFEGNTDEFEIVPR